MNEPIDVQGVWWTPETPDHKVPGWLRYDAAEGGELRLSGSLRPPRWLENIRDGEVVQRVIAEPPRDERIYPRIHGQSGRQLFHLEDSFQLNIEHYLCREDDSAERIHVNWLLTGAWFEGDEPIRVNQAIVHFQHLTDWVGHTGLETDFFNVNPDAPFATVRSNSLAPFRTRIADDCDLSLRQELSTSGDGRNSVVLTQRWALTISAAAPRPLDFFTDRVGDFQDLLSVATGKIANIQAFHFAHDEVPLLSAGGTPVGEARKSLGYYSRWANRSEDDERLSPYSMLFTFDDLGGDGGIQRWMQFAGSYRSELSRVMATRYSSHMFLEDRVTNCVAALEAFDRTRRGDQHQGTYLVERLRNCVAFAGPPFTDLLGGEPVEEWTARAKSHRHTLDHHLDAFRVDTGIVERELGDQLLWLSTLCFLREAGAPDVVFQKIGRHTKFKWLVGRAKARRGRGIN